MVEWMCLGLGVGALAVLGKMVIASRRRTDARSRVERKSAAAPDKVSPVADSASPLFFWARGRMDFGPMTRSRPKNTYTISEIWATPGAMALVAPGPNPPLGGGSGLVRFNGEDETMREW